MSEEEKKEETSKLNLGNLGEVDLVNETDIDDVFDHLEGIIFKMKKCMFRISCIDKQSRTYTVSLINENPETKN